MRPSAARARPARRRPRAASASRGTARRRTRVPGRCASGESGEGRTKDDSAPVLQRSAARAVASGRKSVPGESTNGQRNRDARRTPPLTASLASTIIAKAAMSAARTARQRVGQQRGPSPCPRLARATARVAPDAPRAPSGSAATSSRRPSGKAGQQHARRGQRVECLQDAAIAVELRRSRLATCRRTSCTTRSRK